MAHVPNKAGNYHQGYYKIKHPEKYTGNPSEIVYRSSWEYKFMLYCDLTPGVYKWGSECFRIPYTDYLGKNRVYIPDFYLETRNKNNPDLTNRFLIEVKPKQETIEPVIPSGNISEKKLKNLEYQLSAWQKNKYKWTYAKEWCKNRDMQFWLLTEDHLNSFKI